MVIPGKIRPFSIGYNKKKKRFDNRITICFRRLPLPEKQENLFMQLRALFNEKQSLKKIGTTQCLTLANECQGEIQRGIHHNHRLLRDTDSGHVTLTPGFTDATNSTRRQPYSRREIHRDGCSQLFSNYSHHQPMTKAIQLPVHNGDLNAVTNR